VHLGTRVVQSVCRLKIVSRFETRGVVDRLLLQGVRKVGGVQHLKYWKGCRKECVQEVLRKVLKLWKISEGFKLLISG
jgi:hypothetical protein